MNDIEQIVLDVLKNKEIYVGNGDYLTKIDKNQIAKSIENTIKAVSIDRDEAEKEIGKYLSKFVELDYDELNVLRISAIDKFRDVTVEYLSFYLADKILSLLKPVKTLDRGGVEKILKNNCRDFEWVILKEVSETPEQAFNRVIDAICNLVIKEGDK